MVRTGSGESSTGHLFPPSRQLMDNENATGTRAFVVPLVENRVSSEVEPVDEFLHVLEDSRKLEQAFTVECFDDIVLFVPLLAPAAS